MDTFCYLKSVHFDLSNPIKTTIQVPGTYQIITLKLKDPAE